DKKNGASILAKMILEECTDVVMFVGTAVNTAYQNPDLPADLGIRKMITERFIDAVKALGKRVTVNQY
ncbi:MAG: serine/threonine-protein phosphatase, partial [Clostridium sp.]|nr:serine/threonine-protein phosphatase [Clostridium sp.]